MQDTTYSTYIVQACFIDKLTGKLHDAANGDEAHQGKSRRFEYQDFLVKYSLTVDCLCVQPPSKHGGISSRYRTSQRGRMFYDTTKSIGASTSKSSQCTRQYALCMCADSHEH